MKNGVYWFAGAAAIRCDGLSEFEQSSLGNQGWEQRAIMAGRRECSYTNSIFGFGLAVGQR